MKAVAHHRWKRSPDEVKLGRDKEMGRRILFIAYNYPPVGGLNLPGTQRTTKLIRNLEYERAHVLTVLPNYYPDYVDLNNKVDLPVKTESIHRTRTFDIFNVLIALRKVIIGRHKKSNMGATPHDRKQNKVETYKASHAWYGKTNGSSWQDVKDLLFNVLHYPDEAAPWIIPAICRGLQIILRHEITMIFATGRPWSSMCIGWFLSKITRVPLVVDFRDPWIGNIFHVSMGEVFDRTSIKLECKIVEHARLVFANTEDLRTSFLERYVYVEGNKFITMPNGYDSNDYREVLKDFDQRHSLRHRNKLVIVHAGFLYGARDPSPIIEAMIRLSETDNDGDVVFFQIGKIDLHYSLEETYKDEIASERLVLIEQLPFKECLQKMAGADVLLNIQPRTTTQVPSKLYDYLCLNRPILTITPLDGALGKLILRHGFGDVLSPEDIDGIRVCIERLIRKKRENTNTLAASYPERELFDIRRIAKQMSVSLDNAGI